MPVEESFFSTLRLTLLLRVVAGDALRFSGEFRVLLTSVELELEVMVLPEEEDTFRGDDVITEAPDAELCGVNVPTF